MLYALIEKFRALRAARRGNVTVTFALAIIPVIGAVGAAIDFSHASSIKVALQAALDSTALMLSKEAATLSNTQLQSKALSTFKALFTRPEAKNIKITASYTATSGSTLVIDGTATVETDFMGIVGIKQIEVGGSSTAKWGTARLRVALVLDNTGSMSSSGKMTALKTATKNLLDQLKSAATKNGDVYVSIIPFSKDVNVGSYNYNQNWLDWTEWDQDNGYWSGWGWNKKWKPYNHNTWNGCVSDRGNFDSPSNQNYDQKVIDPIPGVNASYYPAEEYSYCPVEVMGLSYNWSAMESRVNQMTPNGSTNQPIGLVWGWLSLVGGGPFTAPAKNPNYTYQQVIILLSDGLNTEDRWYGNGYSHSTPVDNRMYQTGNGSGTCANIKAAGIGIYAVQVNTGGDPTSNVLKNCASDSSKFFVLTSANQIISTFNEIGTNLSKLRVAK